MLFLNPFFFMSPLIFLGNVFPRTVRKSTVTSSKRSCETSEAGQFLPQVYCKSLIFSVHYIKRFYALSVLASFYFGDWPFLTMLPDTYNVYERPFTLAFRSKMLNSVKYKGLTVLYLHSPK